MARIDRARTTRNAMKRNQSPKRQKSKPKWESPRVRTKQIVTSITRKFSEVRDEKYDCKCFEPSQFETFKEAHLMVQTLVFDDTYQYRQKALELAQEAILRCNYGKDEESANYYMGSAETLVLEAWNSVKYGWCRATGNIIETDWVSSFLCKYACNGERRPLIAFCEYLKLENPQSGFLAERIGKKYAKLLFFRKIKNGFLNAVGEYLGIKYNDKFEGVKYTIDSEKYTTLRNIRRWVGRNAGQHDEEEDSGGEVIPGNPLHKLSLENGLFVFYNGYYMRLSEDQIDALLDLNLYKERVPQGCHSCQRRGSSGFRASTWNASRCRAFKHRSDLFPESFYYPDKEILNQWQNASLYHTRCLQNAGTINAPPWNTFLHCMWGSFNRNYEIVQHPSDPRSWSKRYRKKRQRRTVH